MDESMHQAENRGTLLAYPALPRAGPADRLIAGAVALAGWGLLALAWSLHPDAEGRGTHQQLRLPPCGFRVGTGYPCPSCGMTTAFAAFVHGEPLTALRAQALGTALAAACLLVALGATLTAAAGVHLGPVVNRMFVGRNEWLYVLGVLAAGSWALKAWLDR